MQEDTMTLNTPAEGAGVFDSPGLEGSFQQLLSENLGRYVQIDFLVGVQTIVRRSGFLYAVGKSFVVLYDENNQNFVMCDVFSAKFVAFFARRPRPGEVPNNPVGILNSAATVNHWPIQDMPNPGGLEMPPSANGGLTLPVPASPPGPGWTVYQGQM